LKEKGVEADELNASGEGGQLPTSQVPLTERPIVSDDAETGARHVETAKHETSAPSFDFITATPF
jgi:hypothetical protein